MNKCVFYVAKDADRLPQNLHSLFEKNETMKQDDITLQKYPT